MSAVPVNALQRRALTLILCGMDNFPVKNIETVVGRAYCVTADTPCTISTTLNGREITILSLSKGQSTFIAPSKSVTLRGEAILTLAFKGAALSAQGSGAATIVLAEDSSAPTIPMVHNHWVVLPSIATGACIETANDAATALSMVLEIAPNTSLDEGWLTATTKAGTPAEIRWIAGPPTLPAAGYSYVIGLTQRSPELILANLLTTY